MNEIIFEVAQDEDGGFTAECLTDAIFTEADSWEELRQNVKEAVAAFYFDQSGWLVRAYLLRMEIARSV